MSSGGPGRPCRTPVPSWFGSARNGRLELAGLSPKWRTALEEVEGGIQREAMRQLVQQEERMTAMRSTLGLLGPGATLKRGFSITRVEGKAIRELNALKPGMEVETELESGTFRSEVKEVRSTSAPRQED